MKKVIGAQNVILKETNKIHDQVTKKKKKKKKKKA